MGALDFLKKLMSPEQAGGGIPVNAQPGAGGPVGAEAYKALLAREMERYHGDRDPAVRSANIAGGYGNSTAERFMHEMAAAADPGTTGAIPTPRPDMGGGGGGGVPIPTPRPPAEPGIGSGIPMPEGGIGSGIPTPQLPGMPRIGSGIPMPPPREPGIGSGIPMPPQGIGSGIPTPPPGQYAPIPTPRPSGLTIVPEQIGSGIPTPQRRKGDRLKKRRSQFSLPQPDPGRYGR